MSPVPLGNPSFLSSERPPIAPDNVNVSTGFQVTEIVDDIASELFGCFYVQNETDHIRDMVWEATWSFTTQINPNQAIQTDVGARGEGGGSPQGVDPLTIQGCTIIFNTPSTPPNPDELVIVTPNYPNIEEVNNKMIYMRKDAEGEDLGDTVLYLPAMGAEQHGMEFSVANQIGFKGPDVEIYALGGATIDQVGVPDTNPNNQYSLPESPSAVTFVYDYYALPNGDGTSPDWVVKTHNHIPDGPNV